MTGYCQAAIGDPWHQPYHDTEYGFPVRDETALYERLMLEVNQAGLSWTTVLKKRAGFRREYSLWSADLVAAYGEEDRERLLADPGIIRNRLKVEAAITNAAAVLAMRDSHGEFAGWLDAHHPLPLAGWVQVFRRTFRFTGPEIVREFLVSTGYLPGAHETTCPVYAQVLALSPPWATGAGPEPIPGFREQTSG